MKVFTSFLMLAVLSACAAVPGKFGGPAVLESRVESRWALLIEGKISEAYEYLSPARREVMSRDSYVGRIKPGIWRSGTVSKVTCAEENLCVVEVDVKYSFKPRYAPASEYVKTLRETWRKDSGEWWFVPDD